MAFHSLIKITDGKLYDDGWATRRVVFSIAPLETDGKFLLTGWSPDFSVLLFDSEISLLNGPHIQKRRIGLGEIFSIEILLQANRLSEVAFEAESALLPDEIDHRERSIIVSSIKILTDSGQEI